ncbi:cupredoxin domain-containing protein [Commensalibacter nepenthis]|uniref:Cupredoxin domain-containing protein n=1 Tax=Commensalibacter nepenthis TaxID=3043872 RepID=A0ABT6Q7H3_9PROT|nr:cupredoxin domain-containing protein [Commensalibacter sp. TBRC 10068]MDI2112842.1 cupredoxin domain-containing protein [Commensalibacter sp. TBRC 10068]
MRKLRTILFLFLFIPIPVFATPLANYDITIKDGVFSPQSIEVPSDQRFKITIKNIGQGPAEFENLSLRVEKVLAAGVTSFVVIHPLKPNTYHFIDEFHMDMQGFNIISK